MNNQRINTCITGEYTPTEQHPIMQLATVDWLQSQFINQTSPHLSYTLSTYKNIKINLLHKSFTHNPQHLLLELINEI